MSVSVELVAQRTFRIGVQSLWRDGDRWLVSIHNRTYRSTVEIPPEKAPIWAELLKATGRERSVSRRHFFEERFEPGRGWVTYRVSKSVPTTSTDVEQTAAGAASTTPASTPTVPPPHKEKDRSA